MITGKTSVYAVFGDPVEHSLSPLLHNYGFKKLGIDAVYVAFKPKDAASIVNSIRNLGIKGASITIPFKIEVIDYLDEIDINAKRIGAVNTIINKDGYVIGYNTDGIGASKAIEEVIDLKGKKVVILGYGGSARAISFSIIDKVDSICIAGRDEKKALSLVNELSKINRSFFSSLKTIPEYDILINTTPLGMRNEIPIEKDYIIPNTLVFDIVYKPKDTSLLSEAKKKGCKILYGYKMLLYQAMEQFKIWTAKDMPQEVEDLLLENLY